MIVELTGLNETEGISKAGSPYTFLHVTGMKKGSGKYPGGPWEKRIVVDAHKELFNGFNTGDTVNITFETNAKGFKDVASVSSLNGQGGSTTPAQTSFSPQAYAGPIGSSGTPPAQAGLVDAAGPLAGPAPTMDPDEIVRYEALDMAVNYMTALLQANDKYTKLFKATITADLLQVDLLKLADELGAYIRGEVDTVVKVDDGDLATDPVAGDDDVPF